MTAEMRPWHQQTIARLDERFRDDPRFLALIIGGSVAKGQATDTSDVDILLVARPEEYARRAAAGDLWYYTRDVCDYPDGYVDGKIVDRAFLEEVAERGSEPARSAFDRAILAFSHDAEIAGLLQRIPIYPEGERDEKLLAFYSQIQVHGRFFMHEAVHRNDPYLLSQTAASLALFAGRLILAYNRILFPSQKRLMETVRGAPEQPAGFVPALMEMLRRPDVASARAVVDLINSFQDWGIPYERALTRYMDDTEWRWRRGRPDLADW